MRCSEDCATWRTRQVKYVHIGANERPHHWCTARSTTFLQRTKIVLTAGKPFLRTTLVKPLWAAVLLGALAACSSDGEVCRAASDCASGVCGADGFCQSATEGVDASPPPADGATTTTCVPNQDGVIAAGEAPLAAGLSATFRVATNATVDMAGIESSGSRTWSLSEQLDGDHDLILSLRSAGDRWFSAKFPSATYVTELSSESDLLGVFEVTDSALLLLGVVSPDDGLYRTELAYEPPVRVLSFPFEAGDTWTTDAEVSGLATGVISLYDEDYESLVDASGTLATPYGEFPVLRVRTDLTRVVGAAVVTRRTYVFVSECFGTVASVVSQDYETDDDFDQAAEVRRLAR